jgi:hypothetical protein
MSGDYAGRFFPAIHIDGVTHGLQIRFRITI